jgi:hypothetical protein
MCNARDYAIGAVLS